MRSKVLLTAFVVVAALVFSSACSGNPTGPTTPDPDQSGYEALPAHHMLMDGDGKETVARMWAKLNWVKPLRGSKIIFGNGPAPCGSPQYTGNNCFEFSMNLGFQQPLPNPNSGVDFDVGFSQDGKTIYFRVGGAVLGFDPSGSRDVGERHVYPLGQIPKYLVVEASYSGDVNGTYGTFPGEEGKTSFLLDYK